MANITFKGMPIQTSGELPALGNQAPNFNLVGKDLSEVTLETFGKKKKLLNIFPSIDTSVCATAVKKFYENCHNEKGLVVLNISLDLPFASGRFCGAENLENVQTFSAFRSDFGKDYGVLMMDGPLKGLFARSVVILDENNKVIYSELVPEITQEPDYQAAFDKSISSR